jgi:hypothetical protein
MAPGPYTAEENHVDVRIGVTQSPKEIDIEMPDDADAVKVRAEVDKALKDGATLWLTDRKGRQFGIPAEKIAYFEIGTPDDGRRIGFGG